MNGAYVQARRVIASLVVGTSLAVAVSCYVPLALSRPWTRVAGARPGQTMVIMPGYTCYSGDFVVDAATVSDWSAHLRDLAIQLRGQTYNDLGGSRLDGDCDVSVVEWGWPFRAFWGWSGRSPAGPFRSSLVVVPAWSKYALPPDRGRPTFMPTSPIWPGLLANAAAWSVACWLLTTGVAEIRSQIRRRHGRCGGCSYDLRGLATGAVCPECGEVAT